MKKLSCGREIRRYVELPMRARGGRRIEAGARLAFPIPKSHTHTHTTTYVRSRKRRKEGGQCQSERNASCTYLQLQATHRLLLIFYLPGVLMRYERALDAALSLSLSSFISALILMLPHGCLGGLEGRKRGDDDHRWAPTYGSTHPYQYPFLPKRVPPSWAITHPLSLL